MAETLYVVIGTTGEYSDRTEWLVCAYRERAQAETHAELAKVRAAELFPHRYDEKCDANEYDEQYRAYYTGTDYTVAEVPVLDAVPRPEPS